VDRFSQLQLAIPAGNSEDRREATQQVPSLLGHYFSVSFDPSTLFQRGVKDCPYCTNSMVSMQSQQICHLKRSSCADPLNCLFISGESEWFKSLARIKEIIIVFMEFLKSLFLGRAV